MGSDVEVTAADREKAAEALGWNIAAVYDAEDLERIDAIAAALAAERAKARAPFLRLADESERKGRASSFRDFAGNPWPAHIYPHDLRRAAEDPPDVSQT